MSGKYPLERDKHRMIALLTTCLPTAYTPLPAPTPLGRDRPDAAAASTKTGGHHVHVGRNPIPIPIRLRRLFHLSNPLKATRHPSNMRSTRESDGAWLDQSRSAVLQCPASTRAETGSGPGGDDEEIHLSRTQRSSSEHTRSPSTSTVHVGGG